MAIHQSGICWNCGARLAPEDYGREARCPTCDKSSHVCRNCRFFSPGRPNDCQEPLVERVLDKERANFCDYFEPTEEAATSSSQTSVEEMLKAAEDLFK